MARVALRISATEAIVTDLKDRIRSGEFAPGELLPSEEKLRARYDVSRLTLREAIARLSAVGIVSVRHGKGAVVQDQVSVDALSDVLVPLYPDKRRKRLDDLLESRAVIEGEVAALAAHRRSEEDIELLEKLVTPDTTALKDPQAFADRDFAFHLEVTRIARNSFLLLVYQGLYPPIRDFLVGYARTRKRREQALRRHAPIFEAIVEGDTERARQHARDHMKTCRAGAGGRRVTK